MAPYLASEATIFGSCLMIVALFSHCLPVATVPKQTHITFVRDDMVNNFSRFQPQLTFLTIRTLAQWMCSQECFANFLPTISISTLRRCKAFGFNLLLYLFFVQFTICTKRSYRPTTHMFTWSRRCIWHSLGNKKPAAVKLAGCLITLISQNSRNYILFTAKCR